MSLLKLPLNGTFFQSFVPVAGQTGTGALSPFTVVAPTANEVSITRFLLSGAAIVLDGTNATVTLAAHLNTIVGQQVTFSGATGVTAINNQTWTIGSIVSTSVYTFPCTLTGAVGGTIVQEPVFTIPWGLSLIRTGANAIVEYNSDNLSININGSAAAPTWKTFMAASLVGMIASDGNAVRLRCSGTTATTFMSPIA